MCGEILMFLDVPMPIDSRRDLSNIAFVQDERNTMEHRKGYDDTLHGGSKA